MPYINIRIGCKLNAEQKNKINKKATQLMNQVMGKNPEVTVVHIMESEQDNWSVNSLTLSKDNPIGAYVDIKITEGTNTSEEKSKMIEETVLMLESTVGAIQEACYVVIHDISANSWGYNGKTQQARALKV